MKKISSSLNSIIFVCLTFPLLLQAKETSSPLFYKVLANGTISINDDVQGIIGISPEIFTEGWEYHSFGLPKDKNDAVCELEAGATVDMTTTITPVPHGLKVHYIMVPHQDLQVVGVRVPMYTQYDNWKGRPYQLNDKKNVVPIAPVGGLSIFGETDKGIFSVGPSRSLNGLTFKVEPLQGHLILVDNRKWTPHMMVALTHNESMTKSWSWKTGETKDFEFIITFNRDLVSERPAFTTSNGLEGDWQGYFNTYGKESDPRISAVIRRGAKGAYRAHFTFDDQFLGFYSNSEPTVTFHKNVLKAVYTDGNYVELNLDPSKRSIIGTVTAWGHVRLFAMERGDAFRTPRLNAQGNQVKVDSYQPPQDMKDGFAVDDLRADPKAFSLVTAGVNQLLNEAIPHVHSLLIYHHDKLLLDEYFYGYTPDRSHALYSVTKSVFSTLFGIAQDQGLVKLDQKLYDLYPDYRSKQGWDPRKNDITLAMLMCMDSGFACDNLADSCATDIYKSHDWLDYTLALPLNHVPGQHWTYNGTSLISISNWIATKSGMSIADYAQKYLEGPLGIKARPWETGPNEITRVDASHWLTPREMMKLGVLYLNGGKWNGKRILPKKWVEQAGRPEANKDQPLNFDYGYLWWIKRMTFDKRTIPIIEANGWAGQYIFIVPDLDLVCVMTAGNYPMGSLFTMEEDFFKKYIMTAFYEKNWWDKLTDAVSDKLK